MRIGVTIFATDRTMHPIDLAVAVEARGFDALYIPEHTHMPQDPKGPLPTGATELDEGYRRTLDPYVALSMVAAVTQRVRFGTGVALVAQHDPIVLAKEIATLDQLSGGRFVFGVGYGWNRAEVAHHGVAFAQRRDVAREHILAMQALWANDTASFHGEYVDFDASWSWPKPTTGRVPILIGGAPGPRLFAAIAELADGWLPFGGAGVAAAMPDLREAFEKAGREAETPRVIPFGVIPSREKLDYYATLGIDEVVLRLPAGNRDEVVPVLDEFTTYL